MKSIKEIQEKMEYALSFELSGGGFLMNHLDKCMEVVIFKEILENSFSPEELKCFLENKVKELGKSVRANASNLRGFADVLAIKSCLWILDAKIEDYFDEKNNFIKN
jgi:hypothetical protein